MKLANLENVLKELNSPKTYDDGETLESQFDFEYKVDGRIVKIYDKNECYNFNYQDECYHIACQCSREFGFPKPKWEDFEKDDIYDKIKDACIKDGLDDLIEWYDNVVMYAYTK